MSFSTRAPISHFAELPTTIVSAPTVSIVSAVPVMTVVSTVRITPTIMPVPSATEYTRVAVAMIVTAKDGAKNPAAAVVAVMPVAMLSERGRARSYDQRQSKHYANGNSFESC